MSEAISVNGMSLRASSRTSNTKSAALAKLARKVAVSWLSEALQQQAVAGDVWVRCSHAS